jgi:hypothetical protein
MERYAQEFVAASRWSEEHGIERSPARLTPRPDLVDKNKADPVLRRPLGHYEDREIVNQALAVQMLLLRELSLGIEVPLMLTRGWFEIEGRASYQHGDQLRRKLREEGAAPFMVDGLPLHVWLTSPAFEVIDATLPTILAQVAGKKDQTGVLFFEPDAQPGRGLPPDDCWGPIPGGNRLRDRDFT